MKYFLFAFILTPFFLYSQNNSLNVEIEYLKLINSQQNFEIIADNYRNAELIADSIIYKKSKSENASEFFVLLAQSYSLNNDYKNQAISILRQQLLFPNKKYDIISKDILYDACYKMNIAKENIDEVYYLNKKITESFENNFLIFLKAAIKLNEKELNQELIKYINFYKTINTNYPFWLKQWECFNKIKIKNKKILTLVNFDVKDTNKKLFEFLPDNKQKYILLKAEKYFRKNDAKKQAEFYLKLYTEHELTFIEKIRVLTQKILIKLSKI